MAVRIAMWSGPRNISTAMMRAFENRPDTSVSDEPLYAHYLDQTGRDHPGQDEILRRCETDWRKVAAHLTGPIPGSRQIWYQKHMAQHLLPEIDRDWLADFKHAFLIREPEAMLTSFIKNVPDATAPDTGFPQQVELVRWLEETGATTPPILDARDVLLDPRGMLAALCDRLEIPFDANAMLAWPVGPRETDGVWAKHWYDAVEKSTGFQPYREKDERVPPALEGLLAECRALYTELYERRLAPPG